MIKITVDFGDGLIREYILSHQLEEGVKNGSVVTIDIMHPEHSETFCARVGEK